VWKTDRFNPQQGNSLADARQSLVKGIHSTAATKLLLEQINIEKAQAIAVITTAIEGSWIGYAKGMGLLFHEPKTYEEREIITMQDLRGALRCLSESERLAALYFITGYTRDILYSQVLWGTTHQVAVEDYVMLTMNARFAISRSEMTAGHKTCVGLLYAQIYNRKKQTLQKAVLPGNITISVGMNGRSHTPNWKRPKENYFVHSTHETKDNTTMRMSKKVSSCADMIYPSSIRLTIPIFTISLIFEKQNGF
jgi:hypothetical protein